MNNISIFLFWTRLVVHMIVGTVSQEYGVSAFKSSYTSSDTVLPVNSSLESAGWSCLHLEVSFGLILSMHDVKTRSESIVYINHD